MKKKAKSSYEEFIEDEEQKTLLDKEYKELLLSELLIAAMEHDYISVRKLAAAAGVSPTVIQGLRSGSKTNITIDTLSKVLDAVGYQIIFAPKHETGKRLRRCESLILPQKRASKTRSSQVKETKSTPS